MDSFYSRKIWIFAVFLIKLYFKATVVLKKIDHLKQSLIKNLELICRVFLLNKRARLWNNILI